MNNKFYRSLVLAALLLVGSAPVLLAQSRSQEVINDEMGNPIRIKHEIIVRFDPLHVYTPAIDDTTKVSGPLQDFVTRETVKRLSELLKQDVATIPTFKIFHQLTTTDTISIGRDDQPVRIPPLWSAFVLVLPEWLDEEKVCAEFNEVEGVVEYAHFNDVARLDDTTPPRPRTCDPLYTAEQASLHATNRHPEPADPANRFHVNVEPAWRYVPFGDARIKVGVLDSGIDFLHSDLGDGTAAGSRVRGGWDYLNQQPMTSTDGSRHGTPCAGIIGALRNNETNGSCTGVAGIASGVSLYSLRVGEPLISADRAAEAILDAAISTGRGRSFGVNVMNLSFSYIIARMNSTNEYLIREATQTAYYNKAVMVASRGNDGNSTGVIPATYPTVISVSATSYDGYFKSASNNGPNESYTSNYGDGVDIAAPGTTALVHSTMPQGNYAPFGGTSAAAPHVTGAAALLMSYHSNAGLVLHPEDVEQVLKRTALHKLSNMQNVSPTDLYGAGLLDIGKAITRTRGAARLYHFSGTDATAQRTTIATNARIRVSSRFSSLAAGTTYQGDVIESVVTATHSLPDFKVLGSWSRSSASAPLALKMTLVGIALGYRADPNASITLDEVSVTNTSARLTGYFYHITGTINAPNSLDVWLPYNPNQTTGEYAYTVWAQDPTYVDPYFRAADSPDSPTAADTQARAYPNPSNHEAWVDFAALRSGEQATLELQTLTGQTLTSWTHQAANAGFQTERLSLAGLPAGVYLCRVITSAGVNVIRITKE